MIPEGGDGVAQHIENTRIIVNDHDTDAVPNHRG